MKQKTEIKEIAKQRKEELEEKLKLKKGRRIGL